MPYVTESNLTDIALERWGHIPDPRLREVMTALIKHLHAFVREVEPTEDEWFMGIDFLTRTGHMCDDRRLTSRTLPRLAATNLEDFAIAVANRKQNRTMVRGALTEKLTAKAYPQLSEGQTPLRSMEQQA